MRWTRELAERILGDIPSLGVAQACRRHGVHRATWYRHAAQTWPHGALAGKADPESEILALARSHPHWGCDRIAYCLEVSGIRISSPTVQRILIRHGLGKRSQREQLQQAATLARHTTPADGAGKPQPVPRCTLPTSPTPARNGCRTWTATAP